MVEPRRAFREPEGRLVAGVGTGLAKHLGVTPMSVRVGFIELMFVSGLGILLYGALWVLLPVRVDPPESVAPGLAAASRRGLRTRNRTSAPGDLGVALSYPAASTQTRQGLFPRALAREHSRH